MKMMLSRAPKGSKFLARTALGLALSCGLFAAGTVTPALAATKPAAASKITFSPAFTKAAAELDKTLTDASKNPAVQAAKAQVTAAGNNAAAKAAAVAQVDAALGGGRAKLDAATAAASTPGDRLKLGEMTRTYGILVDDIPLQHRGLVAMLDSGLLPAQSMGQVQFLAGVSAYQLRDYAGAVKYLEPAKASGYQDGQGLLERVLADAYKRTGNNSGALAMAQRDLAAAKASGAKPGEAAIRTALQAAVDTKNAAQSAEYSALLVQHYPSPQAWNVATSVVRASAPYQAQEILDIMRLMSRSGGLTEARDYIEYIQSADARRNPGEVLKVLDAGIAAGKLKPNDVFVSEARSIASSRITADRASLPALERSARAPAATATSVTATADTFLNYGDAAKAAGLYSIALTKPGADTARVLTRLGIAQVDTGNYAGAQATFAKVQGPRQPIANLWAIYAAQKAAGR